MRHVAQSALICKIGPDGKGAARAHRGTIRAGPQRGARILGPVKLEFGISAVPW
jgi:hypothetical protein